MFGSGVKHEIFGNTNGTHAITHERYMGTLLTKVTQSVCDPEPLGATTSDNYILSFCGRLSYTWLLVRWPRNKWRTQKLASNWSRFPIDTTPRKVGIRKTKKREKRWHRVPKKKHMSVSKIPEDPLDGLLMWCPQRRLKTSAQTHRKLDVRPRRCEVQEGADHATVLLLVHRLSVLIHVQHCSHTHQCR
jgi:hypothetical protein